MPSMRRQTLMKRTVALSVAAVWTTLWCLCYTDEAGWFRQRPDSTVEQALSSPSLKPPLTTVTLRKLPSPTTPPVHADAFNELITIHHDGLNPLSLTCPKLPPIEEPALFKLFSNYRL